MKEFIAGGSNYPDGMKKLTEIVKNKGYDYQCSLPAFKEPKDQSRQKVFSAIQKLQPCTNQQIAKYLNRPINEITGRNKELRDKGLVECAFKAPDMESGRLVNFWKLAE